MDDNRLFVFGQTHIALESVSPVFKRLPEGGYCVLRPPFQPAAVRQYSGRYSGISTVEFVMGVAHSYFLSV